MRIRDIEAFQVSWAPDDRPAQRSAFVRVHTDDGLSGIGEASPMQGGLASLGIIQHDLAPALIGQDPLDHAVLHDRLLHRFVKLGPEGAYGHPDHIAISQFATAAAVCASDSGYLDGSSGDRFPSHRVAKLHYMAWPMTSGRLTSQPSAS